MKKTYDKPCAEWLSFCQEETIADGSGGLGNNPWFNPESNDQSIDDTSIDDTSSFQSGG